MGSICRARVAAEKSSVSINHHLRGVDRVATKTLRIEILPLAVKVGRVWISPSDMITIINMFTGNDQFSTMDRLQTIKGLQEASAGGQLEQSSEVNNSTKIGVKRSEACTLTLRSPTYVDCPNHPPEKTNCKQPLKHASSLYVRNVECRR